MKTGQHSLIKKAFALRVSFRFRYLVLTAIIFLPLLWSFVSIRSVYPFTAWNLMMSGGSLEQSWTYYIVRGETVSGTIVDLHPSKLTNALTGRMWSLVGATINNESFELRSPHPLNMQLIGASGGLEKLPRGARVPKLLAVWGDLYNSHLSPSSPDRLKAVRVDVYRWDSGKFGDYDRFVETWRKEL